MVWCNCLHKSSKKKKSGQEHFEKRTVRICRSELGTCNCAELWDVGALPRPWVWVLAPRHFIFVLMRLSRAPSFSLGRGLTCMEGIWMPTPEGSTARFWQELICEIRRAGLLQSIQGPEPKYTAEFQVVRLSVCAQGTSSTFFPKTDKRRTICLFCNIGIKALPHKEKSWLMMFVLNLLLYNHWHNSVIYCFGEVEVWCSTITCFPNLVRLKCGEPIEIKETPVGTFWLILIHEHPGIWKSLCLHCWVRLQNVLMTKLVFGGEVWGEQRRACDKCTRKEKCPKAAKFSFRA